MNFPSFLCVGAQKAGTTTLHDILRQHPGIFMPGQKESKFFFRDDLYAKGGDYYLKTFFSGAGQNQILGEIDPEYLFSEKVPERILKILGPEVKIIFIFRNPVDRAFSHYLMSVRRTYENLSFEEAIQREVQRINKDQFSRIHYSYVSRGLYSEQLKRFLSFFSQKNMKFIIFEEEFIRNREKMIDNLLDWLGVEPYELNIDIRSNPISSYRFRALASFSNRSGLLRRTGKFFLPFPVLRQKLIKKIDQMNQVPSEKPVLRRKTREWLFNDYFKRDIHELGHLIDRQLDCWSPFSEVHDE